MIRPKLLRQALRANQSIQIPTFGTLWDRMLGSDYIREHALELAGDKAGDLHECIRRPNSWCDSIRIAVEVELEDRGYEFDSLDDENLDPGELDEVWDDMAAEIFTKAVIRPKAFDTYLESKNIIRELQGAPCWRAVGLPEGQNPLELDDLGVYWSFTQKGAGVYSAARNWQTLAIYKGTVDLKYVSVEETMLAHMHPTFGEEETEVRFYDGAPIFISEVTLGSGMFRITKPINDWRWC